MIAPKSIPFLSHFPFHNVNTLNGYINDKCSIFCVTIVINLVTQKIFATVQRFDAATTQIKSNNVNHQLKCAKMLTHREI